MASLSAYRAVCTALATVMLGACASTYQPENVAISDIDETAGYRWGPEHQEAVTEDTLLILAFSGGGTRAAALSYGVMQELRDTTFKSGSASRRLLDEVDVISSVSGGSFTAAYYGVYREQLFETFEEDFLRRDVQSSLIERLLSPKQWYQSMQGRDRTEMAIDYYDETTFKGATFDDIARNGRPYIQINATDLTTGQRFTFNQAQFDLLCTDLGSFPVSRAVTASSAVPVAFPTVVLKNHADHCDVTGTKEWKILSERTAETEAQDMLIDSLKSYRNAGERPYVHLVDGGIADNLGLHALIDRVEAAGDTLFSTLTERQVKSVLIVLVNAEVQSAGLIDKTAEKPGVAATIDAVSSAQINRYNQETLDKLDRDIDVLRSRISAANLDTKVYFSHVNFENVPFEDTNDFLNSMPTSLELEDEDIDRLILAGRLILRHESEYQRFSADRGAQRSVSGMSDEELCKTFNPDGCIRLEQR